LRQRVSSTAQKRVDPGARIVTTSLAKDMEKVSMSQAAWLKKRWNRDQCPLPTFPPETMTSVMKRCRWERTQPATMATKVW
jgi:hypothetical protein